MSNLKYHLNRKLPCENILNCEKSTIELLDDLNKDHSAPEYKYICESCEKSFNRSNNLKQHKQNCKIMKNKEKDDEIDKLKAEKKDDLLKTEMKDLTITTLKNINKLGDEDISHIVNDMEFLNKCISSISIGLPNVIEKIYYDKDKPENHNVFIKNIKKKYVIVYKDIQWKVKHMNQVLSIMIVRGCNILQYHLKENYNIEDPNYKKINNYLINIINEKKPEVYQVNSAVTTIINNNRNYNINFINNLENKLEKINIIKYSEQYYQIALENYYKCGHVKFKTGITDLTSDEFHGEIKNLRSWREVIGQLLTANKHLKRNKLRAYLFGYDTANKKDIIDDIQSFNIEVYVLRDIDNKIFMTNMQTNEEIIIK